MISSIFPQCTAFLALLLAARTASGQNFTEAGGQIFTPGFAIVDSPQPGTPLGGETIEVALDVSADGKLPLPPYGSNSPSQIYNITIFLSSYATGKNFTITNGTATANNASLGDIMLSEPGSTVKHVKWIWPDCLVGDGQPSTTDSDRGVYNVSIRQNFRLNGADHYTIFDLPISVTNSISNDSSRPSCASLNNPLLPPDEINRNDTDTLGVLFAPGGATVVQTGDAGGSGMGPPKPTAGPGNGLGNGAGALDGRGAAHWVCLAALGAVVLLW